MLHWPFTTNWRLFQVAYKIDWFNEFFLQGSEECSSSWLLCSSMQQGEVQC